MNKTMKISNFVYVFLVGLISIQFNCTNSEDNIKMYILVNKPDDSFLEDEEILEIAREDIEIEYDSHFEGEPDRRDSISDTEFSELDKRIAKFLKNSNAFVITEKNIIDSTTKILSREKVDYELLCGYDLDAYIIKNDTIKNHFRINSICGFAKLDFENYLFNKKQFLEHLKTLDEIDAESITFKYKTVVLDSMP
jgi:hypothetical protein